MILRVYNKIRKFFKLFVFKLNYGSKFKFKKINFRKSFIVNIEKKGHILVGKNCFFNNYCSLNALLDISIGNDCIFGENVLIYDHNHIFNNKTVLIKDQGFSVDPVKIGNNCWIGSNVVILSGTIIGDNVVVSAGLTIKGDIPSNSIVKRFNNSFFVESINYK